ncbi:hypothetical protein AQZ52_11300 [Novosphingobium fuchskuhlense]|uniref:Peptidase M10 serralysin C-terminal domain-containing protein n=1 Tax=Novosphingobium fuchskuhlense TaxID=1117702 RepID=A0A117UUS6_9SPHN|nr:calcium-binding protein [Novosphingobium fuchskuhlense]KUR71244.1 hypothetical protein AQZ52_11300 [Novosphingobium fuchskuhlense]
MSKITGTSGVDTLTGTDLADTLLGLGGNDTLTGLAGNDKLDGGAGADTMTGGLGNDTYFVDNAGDKVIEKAGEGTDTVNALISYQLTANVENLLLGGTSAINGAGNALDNTLTGNAADNTLWGLAGKDKIDGGAGNDQIVGGSGMDIVTGGAGKDTFFFLSTSDFSSHTSSKADTIVDFTAGDHIDLNQIDAVVSASGYGGGGNQAFHFIGTNSFHNHTGGELRYVVTGGNTYVYGNVNGDTVADFCIKLDGVHTLSASDFVL